VASTAELTAGLEPAAASPRGAAAPIWLRLLALLIAAGFAVPLLWLVLRNLGGEGVGAALRASGALAPLGRSVLLAGCTAVSTAVVGTAAAWLTMRTDLPAARVWRVLLCLPLVVPSFIGAFTLLAAFARGGLLDRLLPAGISPGRIVGFWGAFGVLTLLTYPYVLLPVSARLRQLPASLEESARLLGRSGWSVFAAVVLPQTSGAILAGSLLVFLYTISDFGAVQLLRYDTLTRAIYASRLDQPTSLAYSLQLGALAIAVVAAERALLRGPRRVVGPRDSRPLRVTLGRWRVAATAGVAGLAVFALVAPVTVLAYWSARGVLQGSSRATAVTTDPASLLAPMLNTARASVLTAVVAVVAVLPLAYWTVRYRSRLAGVANAVVVGGFALPGLVVALALVSFALRGPLLVGSLYQTLPLLVFAYTVHFGAQSLRTAQVAVAGVPPRVGDAARMLGASGVRRFAEIELPLMLPGLLAGGGLVLLSVAKELPATLLLAPAGFQTLATRVWNATEDAFWADASLASLVLIALSGVLTWLLVIRRFDALD